VASDSAADFILGDQRPIDENGNVVYSKVVGTEHQLFRLAPGGSPVSLDVAGVEELEASVSADGSLVAFVGKGAGGVRNVWAGTSQVTFNADPALSTSSVAVSPDGSWIAFHSEADLTSQNPDRTWEVFRVTPDGATLEQVSSVTPAPSGDVLLDRVAPSGDGQVLFWGQTTCPGLCTAIDDNALSLHVASPDEAVPTVVPVNEVVRPPFDVVDDVGGIAPAPGCTVAGLDVTCTAILRASPDATRRNGHVPGDGARRLPPRRQAGRRGAARRVADPPARLLDVLPQLPRASRRRRAGRPAGLLALHRPEPPSLTPAARPAA